MTESYISRLIDTMREHALDLIEGLHPVSLNSLPDRQSAIYFLCQGRSEEGFLKVVYIGKAVDIKARWRGHRFKREVQSEVFSLRFKPLSRDRFGSLEHEEALWICLLRPKYNAIAKTKIHYGFDETPRTTGVLSFQ